MQSAITGHRSSLSLGRPTPLAARLRPKASTLARGGAVTWHHRGPQPSARPSTVRAERHTLAGQAGPQPGPRLHEHLTTPRYPRLLQPLGVRLQEEPSGPPYSGRRHAEVSGEHGLQVPLALRRHEAPHQGFGQAQEEDATVPVGVHLLPGLVPLEGPGLEVLAPVAQGGSLLLREDLLLYPPRHEVPPCGHRAQDHPAVALPPLCPHQRRPTAPAEDVSMDQSGVPYSDSVRVRLPRGQQLLLLSDTPPTPPPVTCILYEYCIILRLFNNI